MNALIIRATAITPITIKKIFMVNLFLPIRSLSISAGAPHSNIIFLPETQCDDSDGL